MSSLNIAAFRCTSTFDGRDLVKGTLSRARAIAYDMLIRLVDATPAAHSISFRLFQIIWTWHGRTPLIITVGTHVIMMEPVHDA